MPDVVETLNPHTISNVACACGCDTLMSVGWLHAGKNGSLRQYLYGHKPTVTVPMGTSGIRKHVKSNIGPEQIEVERAGRRGRDRRRWRGRCCAGLRDGAGRGQTP